MQQGSSGDVSGRNSDDDDDGGRRLVSGCSAEKSVG